MNLRVQNSSLRYHSDVNRDNGFSPSHKEKETSPVEIQENKLESKSSNYFPLHKLLDEMKTETGFQKGKKELAVTFLNLIPASITNEVLDGIGEFLGVENLFDYVNPIGTQFSRYLVVDGITKKNLYKPIIESISALALLVVKRTTEASSLFLRPISAIFFYAIETFDDIKKLMITDKKEENIEKLNWSSLLNGLLVTELQLNTVVPLVKMARKSLFLNINNGIFRTIGKIAFTNSLLSGGFAAVGEIAIRGLKLLSKDFSSTEPAIASKIYWQ